MIPTQLIIRGFLSYRDPAEIDFSSLTLACISGPNGSGKSSILDAITWALFGQARKRDESIINTNRDTAEVVLTFQYEGNTYRVIRENSRGKSVNLEFLISSEPNLDNNHDANQAMQITWKTLSERTLRATQSRIEEILRLDYETFINASFFLQGKADQFTQQRPGDRKRILSNILGLDVWESFRKRAVEHRKSVENEILSLDGRLAEINNELDEEDQRKEHLSHLRSNLQVISETRSAQEKILEEIYKISARLEEQRVLVAQLSQQLSTTEKRENELKERLMTKKHEKDDYQSILKNEEDITTRFKSWMEFHDSLNQWEKIAERFHEQEKQRENPLKAIAYEEARLDQERTNLKKQAHEIEKLLNSIPSLQVAKKLHEAEITKIQNKISERKAMDEKLITAQEKLANAKAENPRLKKEMEELKSRIDQLKGSVGAACPTCGQSLSREEKNNLVENLTIIGKTLGDKYRTNQKFLQQADEEVMSLQEIIRKLSTLDNHFLNRKDEVNKINTEIDLLKSRCSKWENEGAKRLVEIEQMFKEENFALDARKELAKVDAELNEIGYDASMHDSIRRMERQTKIADDEHHALELARAAVKPLEDEINNLETQIQTLQSEIYEQRSEYKKVSANLAEAESQAPDLRMAQRNLLDIQEQENQLRMEVGAARQKVIVLDDLKIRKKRIKEERETAGIQVGKYKQLERAFSKDGVPALLIESALPQIETKANQILDRLSDGRMSVRFLTQKEYKDRKRQDMMETLDIQIRDSEGIRDYEMFSGGESFKVNFAIRLALSEILAQRAGARLQTLVIDEGFGSQDEMGRQRLIESITSIKADFAKILVITHIESLKETFPNRIDVIKTSRGSVIRTI